MEVGRKGIFFTVTAIILVGFAIVAFLTLTPDIGPQQPIQTRILTLDNFLIDTKKDFERAVLIGTFRSILAIEQVVIETGGFVDDIDAAFTGAILNASYQNLSLSQVENATLDVWEQRVQQQAERIGAELDVAFHGVRIEHNSPWSVQASVNATIRLSDRAGIASFYANHTARAELSILGFEDPLYLLNSLGRVTNVINVTPYTDFVSGNDTTNLLRHTTGGYYIEHTDAPSFLMRLEGDLGPSPFGIESLVNLTEFQVQLVPIKTRTVVDYLYFGNLTNLTNNCILNVPSWFLIDSAHLTTYEVQSLVC